MLAKDGATKSSYGNTTIFVFPLMFMKNQVDADIPGTCYLRKLGSNSLFALGWDVAHINYDMDSSSGQNNLYVF